MRRVNTFRIRFRFSITVGRSFLITPDPRYRVRRRKFLRVEEEPKFDGKDFTWKMILEDEVKFEVQLYLNTKGMAASYSAEIPEEGTGDNPYVYFRIPGLARENKDRYFGHDFPDEGVKLDDVRKVVHNNEVIMDLPRELRDSRGKGWSQLGFEPGYNTRNFDTLIRHFPSGIRDMKIQGPSFGPRLNPFPNHFEQSSSQRRSGTCRHRTLGVILGCHSPP